MSETDTAMAAARKPNAAIGDPAVQIIPTMTKR